MKRRERLHLTLPIGKTALGSYVRLHRVSARMSMRALASCIGVHWTLIGQWERGKSRVIPKHWGPLADALPEMSPHDMAELARLDGRPG